MTTSPSETPVAAPAEAPAPGAEPPAELPYARSRFRGARWRTRAVPIGETAVGGDNPIRVQSMTTTNTEDIEATVHQSIALAEAGCEIIRITAPNQRAARALRPIREQFRAAGFTTPLVADIHFAPKAAMEAVQHVEKVRINPGNYADRKKFAVREYSDREYESELQRLYEAFSPIVKECLRLGKAMRIGTNHGSLSDRIMNRYGDTPEGMVQSAFEFIRIAQSHGFHDIVLSMKASNPKVMIAAYRLAVARMRELGWDYPLHLGVTEAGGGEDGRIKSAIGIGSLLEDGIGDTIRVSLTEDPVHEVPVGQELARRAMALWREGPPGDEPPPPADGIHPYVFARRPVSPRSLAPGLRVGGDQPPAVVTRTHRPLAEDRAIVREVCGVQTRFQDARIEVLLVRAEEPADLSRLPLLGEPLHSVVPVLAVELAETLTPADLRPEDFPGPQQWMLVRRFGPEADRGEYAAWIERAGALGLSLATALEPTAPLAPLRAALTGEDPALVLTLHPATLARQLADTGDHPVGAYRLLARRAAEADLALPLWIRSTPETEIEGGEGNTPGMIETSLLAGPLLCDGLGDLVSAERFADPATATATAFNILQGTRARITRTEYVACPSCGRTLFDLESTTAAIREKTDHLKGVTIAVMGCIVNGPGEMADADFGYVGGAPGKINLYVGKECVQVGIPQAEAVDRLIDLIRDHGKWVEPPARVSP